MTAGAAPAKVQPRDQVGGEEDYYLTVRIWVRDAGGRLLLTRRQGDRVWYPGCWEVPGGFAQAGETGLWPPGRELAEETGLTPGEKAWRLGTYLYQDVFSQHWYHTMVASYLVQLPEERTSIRPQETEGSGLAVGSGSDYPAFQTQRDMEPFTFRPASSCTDSRS